MWKNTLLFCTSIMVSCGFFRTHLPHVIKVGLGLPRKAVLQGQEFLQPISHLFVTLKERRVVLVVATFCTIYTQSCGEMYQIKDSE